ncbi:MAG: hypothetical protein QM790_15880 [Nibricoccus sp.]
MKPLAVVLAISIAANAALAVLFVRMSGSKSDQAAAAVSTTLTATKAAVPAGSGVGEAMSVVLDSKTWSNLQSSDLKAFAERLRAAGFPPSLVRAIVAAIVDEKYSGPRKALLAKQEDVPYWQRGSFNYDAKLMSELRESNKKEREELKAILGADGVPNNDERLAWQKRQYGDLSADKLEQMQSILSDYGELRNEVYSKANGMLLPEDREKISLLEKEQRSDLASLLSPDELLNYELRSSGTANVIRSQLSIFKPSEAEFRALFLATRAAEDQYGSVATGYVGNDQAMKIRDTILAKMQDQLSADRYEELKQATDPKYSLVNRIAARLDLPVSTAVQAASIQQDVQQRAATIRRNNELSVEDRTAQLASLAQEATSKLTTTLTARGFDAYKQYTGNWIQNLTQAPKRTGQ